MSMILLLSVNEANCLDHQDRRTGGTTDRHHCRRSAYRASGLVLRPGAVIRLADVLVSKQRKRNFEDDRSELAQGASSCQSVRIDLARPPRVLVAHNAIRRVAILCGLRCRLRVDKPGALQAGQQLRQVTSRTALAGGACVAKVTGQR